MKVSSRLSAICASIHVAHAAISPHTCSDIPSKSHFLVCFAVKGTRVRQLYDGMSVLTLVAGSSSVKSTY